MIYVDSRVLFSQFVSGFFRFTKVPGHYSPGILGREVISSLVHPFKLFVERLRKGSISGEKPEDKIKAHRIHDFFLVGDVRQKAFYHLTLPSHTLEIKSRSLKVSGSLNRRHNELRHIYLHTREGIPL